MLSFDAEERKETELPKRIIEALEISRFHKHLKQNSVEKKSDWLLIDKFATFVFVEMIVFHAFLSFVA